MSGRQKAEGQKPVNKTSANNKQIVAPQTTKTTADEEMLTVRMDVAPGRGPGINLVSADAGLILAEFSRKGVAALDGRLQRHDRLLFVNGQDVRGLDAERVENMMCDCDRLSLTVARKKASNGNAANGEDTDDGSAHSNDDSSLTISHTRSKSAPAINKEVDAGAGEGNNGRSEDEDEDEEEEESRAITKAEINFARTRSDSTRSSGRRRRKSSSGGRSAAARAARRATAAAQADNGKEHHHYEVPNGPNGGEEDTEDYMAIYETLDRVRDRGQMSSASGACAAPKSQRHPRDADSLGRGKSHSMEALETPTPSLKSFEFPESAEDKADKDKDQQQGRKRHGSKSQTESALQRNQHHRQSNGHHRHKSAANGSPPSQAPHPPPPYPSPPPPAGAASAPSVAAFLKRALRIEGPQLCRRVVTVKKNVRESLGMRIGGGIGSNEGDTPIYIANIHPHGCIGKSKQMKVSAGREKAFPWE